MYASTLACVALAMVSIVDGYSSGAGASVCSTMIPGHHVTGQNSTSPYTVGVNTSSYDLGGSVTVTLSGSSIRGFLIKALRENDLSGSAIGSFSVATENAGTALSQDRCAGGATHTSDFVLLTPNVLHLTWNAPSVAAGNIKFYATVVKHQLEFWVQVPSAILTANITTTPSTTSTSTASPLTTSTSTASPLTTSISTASPLTASASTASPLTTSTSTTRTTTASTSTTTTMTNNSSTVSRVAAGATSQPMNATSRGTSVSGAPKLWVNLALPTLGTAILLLFR